ncbi:MAG: 3-phosphoshikimate 1-carboxyvinyltransferase, partial [Clostridia bacterium]
NVGINSSRTGVLDVLRNMGGNIEITNIHNDVEPYADIVVESSKLHGVRISGDIIPNVIDELPILAVAAAFADGFTTISDALELRNKESDRISAMVCELKKAHIEVAESPDGMIIYGGSNVSGASFSSHNDHRVAMSMAILSLAATGGSTIDGVECISISYPDFFDDLNKIVKWR